MVIDVGQGPPVVLIPGIQGRWEYLQPAIDALSRTFRVLTFPLSGERGCDVPFDPALGYDNDARQVLTLLDRRGIERATICGISFGGLPAIRFAAAHPDRSGALILVSTPGPGWHLRPKHRVYVRAPVDVWSALPDRVAASASSRGRRRRCRRRLTAGASYGGRSARSLAPRCRPRGWPGADSSSPTTDIVDDCIEGARTHARRHR